MIIDEEENNSRYVFADTGRLGFVWVPTEATALDGARVQLPPIVADLCQRTAEGAMVEEPLLAASPTIRIGRGGGF